MKNSFELFVKEYTILRENNNIELLLSFTSRWNHLFRDYGYYNIQPHSILDISKIIIKKNNKSLENR